MAQIAMDCPHCKAQNAGFTGRGCYQMGPDSPLAIVLLQCGICYHCVVAVTDLPTASHWISGRGRAPVMATSYPKPEALKAPPDTPPNVQRAFLSGLDNLSRPNGTNAAAIMFRNSIEIAVKSLPDAPTSGNLKERINGLSPDLATPAMKAWAHHVRLEANEAAHEPEEFTKEDAKRLHVFAEMFLTYAFTLPAMLAKAKGEPETA